MKVPMKIKDGNNERDFTEADLACVKAGEAYYRIEYATSGRTYGYVYDGEGLGYELRVLGERERLIMQNPAIFWDTLCDVMRGGEFTFYKVAIE